jgi:thiamine transport system permease protein
MAAVGTVMGARSPSLTKIVLSLGLVGLFAFPYFILALHAGTWSWPEIDQTVFVFGFTFLQALLSATSSLVTGVIAALGLSWLAQRKGARAGAWAELFALLPNAAPVILLLLASFKFLPMARGLSGIVIVHTLLNAGLVAVSVLYLFKNRIGGMAELAWVEGASGRRFFFRGVLPYLKTELSLIWFFVFAICFSSFAVPLMVGGARATTVEVLIYQKIRITGDWGQALTLAAFQALVIFALTWLLRSRSAPVVVPRRIGLPLLGSAWGLPFAFAPGFLIVAGLFDEFWVGFAKLAAMETLVGEIPSLIAGSAAVAIGTGGLVTSLLLLIAYLNPSGAARKLLLGYAAPSSVLMGFAVLIAWRATGWASHAKIILGLSLVTVPALYRLRWDALIESLRGQRIVGASLGAGEGLIFRRIVFPQIATSAFWIGGLAAVWAWGDFALSSVVAERSITIAMVVQGLMGSYRLEAATALIWLLILGAGITFVVFVAIGAGVGRVFGPKSEM